MAKEKQEEQEEGQQEGEEEYSFFHEDKKIFHEMNRETEKNREGSTMFNTANKLTPTLLGEEEANNRQNNQQQQTPFKYNLTF